MSLPIVEAERLFINVAERVERFDRNISSVETALEETPKILASVRVYIPVHVGYSVVTHLMLKLIKPVIRLRRVAIE